MFIKGSTRLVDPFLLLTDMNKKDVQNILSIFMLPQLTHF